MTTTRMEAFSDAVIAIVITIMVLEFQVPEGAEWASLRGVTPMFLAYVLSFVFLGIYWSNHHHLLHLTERVNGAVLWANLHLLFWLSLIPFATHWMEASEFAPVPVAVYGGILLFIAVAYFVLERAILACEDANQQLAEALEAHGKEKVSAAAYVVALPLAFVEPWASIALYMGVAILWLVPDRRIEERAG